MNSRISCVTALFILAALLTTVLSSGCKHRDNPVGPDTTRVDTSHKPDTTPSVGYLFDSASPSRSTLTISGNGAKVACAGSTIDSIGTGRIGFIYVLNAATGAIVCKI